MTKPRTKQVVALPANDPVNTGNTVFDSPAVKHKLPLYLQNMFLACGFDTLDAIAELNVHGSGLNYIDRMLKYVNSTFPQDQRLVASHLLSYIIAMYMCSWLLVH